jgi:hypothetical protein
VSGAGAAFPAPRAGPLRAGRPVSSPRAPSPARVVAPSGREEPGPELVSPPAAAGGRSPSGGPSPTSVLDWAQLGGSKAGPFLQPADPEVSSDGLRLHPGAPLEAHWPGLQVAGMPAGPALSSCPTGLEGGPAAVEPWLWIPKGARDPRLGFPANKSEVRRRHFFSFRTLTRTPDPPPLTLSFAKAVMGGDGRNKRRMEAGDSGEGRWLQQSGGDGGSGGGSRSQAGGGGYRQDLDRPAASGGGGYR